jgi:hypothetical protein
VTGTQVDLDATGAPLPEVLDRLARLTGMKLIFDGAPPRPLVTISVHGRSPTQTVLAVLEGLGINYALIADATGAQVQTLLVTGAAAPSSATRGRGPSPPPRANRNMPIAPEPADLPLENEDELPLDEGGVVGNEPGREGVLPPDNPGDAPPVGGEPRSSTVPPGQPSGFGSQPQPYTPGPFLPPAPTTAQPLTIQPFPTPTPTPPP